MKRTYESREVARRDPLVVDVVEVDVGEERLTLDLLGICLASSKSSRRVSLEQLRKNETPNRSSVCALLNRATREGERLTPCRSLTALGCIVMGYSGGSSRMASKISSSSSPRKGDWPSSISYVSTPKAHQSTARVYGRSSRICTEQNPRESVFSNKERERGEGCAPREP